MPNTQERDEDEESEEEGLDKPSKKRSRDTEDGRSVKVTDDVLDDLTGPSKAARVDAEVEGANKVEVRTMDFDEAASLNKKLMSAGQ